MPERLGHEYDELPLVDMSQVYLVLNNIPVLRPEDISEVLEDFAEGVEETADHELEIDCSQKRSEKTGQELEELKSAREKERFDDCLTRTVELLLDAQDELEELGVPTLKVTEN